MHEMTTLISVLDAKVSGAPHFPVYTFLHDGEEQATSLTYLEFGRRARAIGALLQARQLKGERVLLLLPQGLDYIAAFFGCLLAGAIAVPAYPPRNNHHLKRLALIAEDAGAALFIADSATVQAIRKMDEQFLNLPALDIDEVPLLQSDWQGTDASPDDIAYLQYTSGSTSTPKGVAISHKNALHNALAVKVASRMDESQKVVTWAPIYHDMGLVFGMLAPFISGAQVVFMAPNQFIQKPIRWLEAISRHRGTITFAPNFAYNLCVEKIRAEDCTRLELSSLRLAVLGAEPVRLATMVQFRDKFRPYGLEMDALCPCYGLAESTLFVSYTPWRQPLSSERSDYRYHPSFLEPGKTERTSLLDSPAVPPEMQHKCLVSNGVPGVPGSKIAIVDPITNRPCREMEEGEIWVSYTDSIPSGYWNNPEATAHTFRAELDGEAGQYYLRTGDLGFLCKGELFITGRAKGLIIIRGRNIYPQDIEYAVERAHPAMASHSGAAFSVDVDEEERLVVVQEVRRENWKTLDVDAAFDSIRRAISDEFDIAVQAIVLILPMSLPKTTSGKVQRQLAKKLMLGSGLKELARWEASQHIIEDASPSGLADHSSLSIQHWLVRKIAEKAEMAPESVYAKDAVQQYPLDSIDAMALAEELTDWLGVKVGAEAFWALPSIEALAEYLAGKCEAGQNV